MWQALRSELHPHGLEVVTVALDTAGAERAGRYIDRASPEHPSLIDTAHLLDELYGFVNVPSAVWIDEELRVVRPPETAYHPDSPVLRRRPPGDAPPLLAEVLRESARIHTYHEGYVDALRDWVRLGAASRYALPAEQVVGRFDRRSRQAAEAAAEFELGQHLHRFGHERDAVARFRAAHRLHPDNWTYKRQAWSLVDPLQGPTEEYDGDWLTDVRRIGPENYYRRPAL